MYATGASDIAVPGWPLPTFCTASAASAREYATTLSSSAFHPVTTLILYPFLVVTDNQIRQEAIHTNVDPAIWRPTRISGKSVNHCTYPINP